MVKMLENEILVDELLGKNPFHGIFAPDFVKVDLYEYTFANDGKNWWERKFLREYVPIINRGNAQVN